MAIKKISEFRLHKSMYRISLIRRRGYYNFHHAGPRGDCSRTAFGGGNKCQVLVGHIYFGKESLH